MSLGRYALLVVGVAASSLLVAWPLGLRRMEAAGRWAAVYGATLAVLNTIAAHAILLWSNRRSTNVFLGMVLGGMVGRMALLLGAVVAGVLLLGLPKVPLAVCLLLYFVLFLVMGGLGKEEKKRGDVNKVYKPVDQSQNTFSLFDERIFYAAAGLKFPESHFPKLAVGR